MRHWFLEPDSVDDLGTRVDRFTSPMDTHRRCRRKPSSYLTLPSLRGAIAIYGEGRAAQILSGLAGLERVRLLYGGDIDPHGFSILNGLHRLFPHCQSILVDEPAYRSIATKLGFLAPRKGMDTPDFSLLSESEAAITFQVNQRRLGVEQEKVPAEMVGDVFDNA